MTETLVEIELTVKVVLVKVVESGDWWEVKYVTEQKLPEVGKFMTTSSVNKMKRRFGA